MSMLSLTSLGISWGPSGQQNSNQYVTLSLFMSMLTFLKEIAENIPKDCPKSKEKKQKEQKGEKREEGKEREQGKKIKGRGCWESSDFTVGCTVVTKAAKQKAHHNGQKGKVEKSCPSIWTFCCSQDRLRAKVRSSPKRCVPWNRPREKTRRISLAKSARQQKTCLAMWILNSAAHHSSKPVSKCADFIARPSLCWQSCDLGLSWHNCKLTLINAHKR